MKRSLVVLAVALGLVFLIVSRRSDRDVRTGVWSGKTTQGLPFQMKIAKHRGELVVEEWQMLFESHCEKSGRVLRIGVRARAGLPVADGKFAQEIRFVGVWDRLN